jgi:hypothetical protein
MASRSIKGILARNSWDFYEYSTGWAYVSGPFAGVGHSAYLQNPGTQQANLDIYRAEISLSSAVPIEWDVYPLAGAAGPDISTERAINSCETNQPMPLGAVAMAGAPWAAPYVPIRQRLDGALYDSIMLGMDGPFVTLAPGWAILVQQIGSGSATVAVTFFFQTILDQISQAR